MTTVARRTLFRLLVAFTLVWIGWAGWSLIGRSDSYRLRVLDDLGSPIAGAVIDSNGSQLGITGANGTVELVWTRSRRILEVSAPGHVSRTTTVNEAPESNLDVVLRARVLRGRVVDSEGVGLEGALVVAGSATGLSDSQGVFQVRGAEEGTVEVERPAWLPATFEWDEAGPGEQTVELEPFTARAVHIGGELAVADLDSYVDMAMDTELNALMIDIKDETGHVFYDTNVSTAIDADAVPAETFDLTDTVTHAHDLGLYVIARIVVFNDPLVAQSRSDLAVWDSATDAPYEANGQFFLDPTDRAARQYGIDLGVEACELGVDEIQFDYVRFPDDRRESATFDGGVSPEVRKSAISGFLNEAVNMLRPKGCAVAADIFGYLTTATNDGGIGQRWEEVAGIVDVISPMLYPSHYDANWYGFPDPDDYPAEMIDEALADGMRRLTRKPVIRPWLQDFDYQAADVRAEIAATEEYGLGWMLWNSESKVTVDALEPAE
ncbi:MAG TPA: putative glycoside hydrolase [Acidimicrobiia bacterium]|nr:putative glycoside hydrolase [Acidimicrobiia bacterium]